MPLTLTVLRCPDSVPPETRSVAGGEFSVGRGPGVDWVLPDPERLLSKHHFAVAYRGGAWQIADTSTNGTTMNRDAAPIGQAELRTLRDGDRLTLGAYEIEVRLTEDVMPQAGMAGGMSGGMGGGFGAPPPGRGGSPFGDPFALDPLAPPPPPRQPFDQAPSSFGMAQTAAQLPQDFDPLAPEPGGSPFLGPTQADHSPVLEDAFRPPPTIGAMPLHSGGTLPGDDLLPDDWDKDLLQGINAAPAPFAPAPAAPAPAAPAPPPAARSAPPIQAPIQAPMADPFAEPPPAQRPAQPMAQPLVQPVAQPLAQPVAQPMVQPVLQPVAQPVVQPVAQPFAQPLAPAAAATPQGLAPAEDHDPFAEADVPSRRIGEPAAPPHAASPFDEPFDLEPVPAPPPRAAPPPSAPPPTASPQPAAVPAQAASAHAAAAPAAPALDAGLLAAFLEGAGMADVQPGDPAAMMRNLGQAFRTLVSGLRAVLIARASIKSEFRIEQTMIRARGNNPLKFSAGDDDALAALLGTGRRTDMTAAAAVADALKDIRLHELASMAAMQSAVRTLLDGLDPAKLRAQADQGGGLSLLPAQKKARAWDAFEQLHGRTVQALADDFDSVFGKAFARAYERALDEVAARER
jgi:type VI secretion system FHA domain protein